MLAYSLIINLLLLIMFLAGKLVYMYEVKVNYTRKIIHFAWFFVPSYLCFITKISNPQDKILISLLSLATVLGLMIKPLREKSSFLTLCFMSIDRPEDRPNTLKWLLSQTLAGYLILIFFYKAFLYYNIPINLLYLTILAVTIGDGIAEPIGTKFGTYRYQVKGFRDARIFYRTIEGSVSIYAISFLTCFAFREFFNNRAFFALLIIYPLVITLVEAASPHTWDTPYLFFFGNLIVMILVLIN